MGTKFTTIIFLSLYVLFNKLCISGMYIFVNVSMEKILWDVRLIRNEIWIVANETNNKSDAIYQNLLTVFPFCYGLFHFDDGDMLKIENWAP